MGFQMLNLWPVNFKLEDAIAAEQHGQTSAMFAFSWTPGMRANNPKITAGNTSIIVRRVRTRNATAVRLGLADVTGTAPPLCCEPPHLHLHLGRPIGVAQDSCVLFA